MLADQASQPLSFLSSLTVSGIGFLVVFLELILLAIMIMLVSKVVNRMAGKEPAPAAATPAAAAVPAPAAATATVPAPAAVPAPAPAANLVSQGQVDVVNIPEEIVAVLMAVTAQESGIPLDQLNIKSIREV